MNVFGRHDQEAHRPMDRERTLNMTWNLKTAAIALAAPSLMLAAPAAAFETAPMSAQPTYASTYSDVNANQWRDRYDRRYDRRNYGRYDDRRYYEEPVYRDTRVWRGEDGRYYCRKKNGTTGLIIGGAAGALLGREIAGRGDRTLGAILGAAGGAILGREIDRGGSRCR
jgi:hypothetical protein